MPDDAKDGSASPSDVTSLRRSSDFRRVLSTGRRSKRGPVTVVGAAGSEPGIRVGLVVRRDVGNAVRRNRVKRRVRHALGEVSLEQGMDYVIIASPHVGGMPFVDLREALQRAADGVR